MTCTGRYAEVSDYDAFTCAGIDMTDPDQIAQVELYLDMAASDIQSALASAGACSCSLAAWTVNYLKKLNVIDAAVIHNCPCGSIPDERKQLWVNWLNGQFELIRTGKLELCDGETGADYPAFATSVRAWTEFNTAEIMYQTLIKNP